MRVTIRPEPFGPHASELAQDTITDPRVRDHLSDAIGIKHQLAAENVRLGSSASVVFATDCLFGSVFFRAGHS